MNALMTWGPGLDAEVDYRTEQLRAQGVRAGRRRATWWRTRTARRTTSPAAAPAAVAAVARAVDEGSRRRRSLPGSEAWRAAAR